MPSLKAMPGRVVLKFPSAPEKIGAIHVPQTSQMRPEFPEIHDVGAALRAEDEPLRRTLLEWKKAGISVAVSFQSGVSYWKAEYDQREYGWLKDLRVYSFGEIASCLANDGEKS